MLRPLGLQVQAPSAGMNRKLHKAPVAQGERVSDLLHQPAHKSMGLEGIHPKELAEVLTEPPSIIQQQPWLTGEVPADWRLANITPIYKKGQKEHVGNYRSVSLISVLGQVMEQIILSDLKGLFQPKGFCDSVIL